MAERGRGESPVAGRATAGKMLAKPSTTSARSASGTRHAPGARAGVSCLPKSPDISTTIPRARSWRRYPGFEQANIAGHGAGSTPGSRVVPPVADDLVVLSHLLRIDMCPTTPRTRRYLDVTEAGIWR